MRDAAKERVQQLEQEKARVALQIQEAERLCSMHEELEATLQVLADECDHQKELRKQLKELKRQQVEMDSDSEDSEEFSEGAAAKIPRKELSEYGDSPGQEEERGAGPAEFRLRHQKHSLRGKLNSKLEELAHTRLRQDSLWSHCCVMGGAFPEAPQRALSLLLRERKAIRLNIDIATTIARTGLLFPLRTLRKSFSKRVRVLGDGVEVRELRGGGMALGSPSLLGSFGVGMDSQNMHCDSEKVLKAIPLAKFARIQRDVLLAHSVRSPLIVPIEGIFLDGRFCVLQFPYYSSGNLRQWLNEDAAKKGRSKSNGRSKKSKGRPGLINFVRGHEEVEVVVSRARSATKTMCLECSERIIRTTLCTSRILVYLPQVFHESCLTIRL